MCDKCAGQFAVHDVMSELQGQQIACDLFLEHVGLRRIEFHLKIKHRLLGGHVAFQLGFDFFFMIQPELSNTHLRQALKTINMIRTN